MTDDDKIEAIIESLTDNALGDIIRASTGSSKMGAFILCSCLIDAMAGFEKGSDTHGSDFQSFVRTRLTSYNPVDLYKDLRCKLVHSYSEGGSYSFVDGKHHLHGGTDGTKTVINLEDFISDISSALNGFAADIRSGGISSLRANAISRYDNNGIIGVSSVSVSPALGTATISTLSVPLSGRK